MVMAGKPDEEWVRADPRVRRYTFLFLVAAAIVGTVAFLALDRWLARVQISDPDFALEEIRQSLIWISVAMGLSLFAFAAYLWVLGGRILRSEQFPPPGMIVVRDVLLMKGPFARRRARLVQALAIILATSGLAVMVVTSYWIVSGS